LSLGPGTRLGPYEVVAPLGAGGMGEVWRARDTKLDREAALKFLPPSFAEDPERLARFEREAKVLASLNQPNIAAIYGFHEHDGYRFLAMELVPGEDLAERLKRGPIPVAEAVGIARQIAEALEVAHEQGVVHRDLKPANVKITPDGKAKVLDFGLAKALESSVASGPARDAAMSPTITSLGTVAGVILGTAAYMSPEQARGRSVDKRADIWAFGAVLYEMLAGKLAFDGDTISDTMAAVLTREPDWNAIPANVPPRVRELMERCLRKDAKERLRDIGDARIQLGEAAAGGPSPTTGQSPKVPSPKRWLPIILGAAVVVAAIVGTLLGRRSVHADLPTYQQLTYARGYVHSARFTPDGQTVVYGAAFEGRPLALFSTRAGSADSRPFDLPGADIAGISKDGQMALLLGRHHYGSWLRVGTLAQASLAGGTPREILEQVFDADISPDGKQFAVVVVDGDDQVLQFPIGKEIFRTRGWIGAVRIAPDGKRVAFVDHRVWGDDLGQAKLVEADGKVVTLSDENQFSQGLTWSPDGSEVWFTAWIDGAGGTIWKVKPGGPARAVLTIPSGLRIEDIAADGRILLMVDEARATLAGQLAGDAGERIYSWWTDDSATAIASDGSIYAGDNGSVVAEGEYLVFFRRGATPPVQLGTGISAGMTPDGKFVFTAHLTGKGSSFTRFPVGPGQPKTIELGDLTTEAGAAQRRITFSSDGRRAAFIASKPGAGRAVWMMDGDGGTPRCVSPEGAYSAVISPDGSKVAVGDPKRGLYVVSDAGGPVPVAGAPKEDVPLAWSADGRAVLSWDRTLPPRIYSTALDGGHREVVRELFPADPAGNLYGWLTLSPDGRYYMLRTRRVLTTVYLVTLH
jgi:eukaryotic-like serine/threonine-protein kinase